MLNRFRANAANVLAAGEIKGKGEVDSMQMGTLERVIPTSITKGS
jgi:hypothetical protein